MNYFASSTKNTNSIGNGGEDFSDLAFVGIATGGLFVFTCLLVLLVRRRDCYDGLLNRFGLLRQEEQEENQPEDSDPKAGQAPYHGVQ